MNALSQKILSDYQVRKTRAQKTAFIEMMQREIPGLKIEEDGLSLSRNLIVGDPETARIIVGAHYDTCAQLPFPNLIMPKNMLFTILYSFLIVLPFLALMAMTYWLLSLSPIPEAYHPLIALIVYFGAFFGVFMLGKPNPHTANDNTSGILLLTELLDSRPDDVAFIFFDNEENGLLGSGLYRKMHKKAIKNQLMINADCIGDGNNILLVINKKAEAAYGDAIRAAFAPDQALSIHFAKSSTTHYPSDQQGFPRSVAIAALKSSRFGLYMNRIHTKHDTILEERNLEYVAASLKSLLGAL